MSANFEITFFYKFGMRSEHIKKTMINFMGKCMLYQNDKLKGP